MAIHCKKTIKLTKSTEVAIHYKKTIKLTKSTEVADQFYCFLIVYCNTLQENNKTDKINQTWQYTLHIKKTIKALTLKPRSIETVWFELAIKNCVQPKKNDYCHFILWQLIVIITLICILSLDDQNKLHTLFSRRWPWGPGLEESSIWQIMPPGLSPSDDFDWMV